MLDALCSITDTVVFLGLAVFTEKTCYCSAVCVVFVSQRNIPGFCNTRECSHATTGLGINVVSQTHGLGKKRRAHVTFLKPFVFPIQRVTHAAPAVYASFSCF